MLKTRDRLDIEDKGLRKNLLETCTRMGERFPECDKWMATEKTENEQYWKRVKELESPLAADKNKSSPTAFSKVSEEINVRRLHLFEFEDQPPQSTSGHSVDPFSPLFFFAPGSFSLWLVMLA